MININTFYRCVSFFYLSIFVAVADEGKIITANDCLYAFTSDGKSITACEDHDPLSLKDNPDILKVMRYADIDPQSVYFRGCDQGDFYVSELDNGKSVVNYDASIQIGQLLAPVVHELMHVLQIRSANGLVALREQLGSLPLELEADYMAGVIYTRLFSARELKEFEQNLKLTGRYKENAAQAHGTPEQRDVAFRFGVFLRDDQISITELRNYFEGDVLGDVLAVSPNQFPDVTTNSGLKLDKLSQCQDIARLSAPATFWTSNCRAPQGELEESLDQRTSGKLCFISTPYVQMLSGFSCVKVVDGTGKDLTCFRAAKRSDILSYKQNYTDVTMQHAHAYQIAASQCDVTNGNTTVAVSTTMPIVVAFIARFELGFISPLGHGKKTDSFIQHGFASIDPAIVNNGTDAVEYIDLLQGGNLNPERGEISRVGEWVLTTNHPEFNTDLMKGSGQTIVQNGMSIRLTNNSTPAKSDAQKLEIIRHYQRLLDKMLAEEGFSVIRTFQFDDPIISQFANAVPYGRREFGGQATERVIIFMNNSNPICSDHNLGALGVLSLTSRPRKNIASDYGDFNFVVYGLGTCATHQPAVKKYMEQLRNLAALKLSELLQSN